MDYERIRATLARDEGCNLQRHDVQGTDHIGYGFNLEIEWSNEKLDFLGVEDEDDIQEITQAQADTILDDEIKRFSEQTERIYADIWEELSPLRQEVLVNLCFNLGQAGLRKFRKMNAAIREGQYAEAAKHMLDSKAARQTGQRYIRLSRAFSTNNEAELQLDRLYDVPVATAEDVLEGDKFIAIPLSDASDKELLDEIARRMGT